MSEIHGTCSDQFDGVRQTLSRSLDSGKDIGASVAVFIDGDPVVDVWGGYADGNGRKDGGWRSGEAPAARGRSTTSTPA